jgi:hypothetical protein
MPMHFDARRDELIRTILKSFRLPAFLFHFPCRRALGRSCSNSGFAPM